MNKLDRYFVIYPYSYFGESTRDLGLTSELDILCVNPGFYISNGTKLKISRNEKSEVCTMKNITIINHSFKQSTINALKALGAWRKSKEPVFLCSDKVAGVLGLDVDGDIVLIQEAENG